MAETLEQLIVDINADTTGFEGGLRRVDRGVGGISAGLLKFGGILAGVFATKKLVDFGVATVTLASSAEELQNKFDVVFRGITESTESWIEEYSSATARGVQDTKDFLTSLQDIQTGYGRSITEASKFSKAVIGITNDLVSFSDVPVEQASAAIQSALAGNLEAVRSLGVSINVATIDQSDYAKSIGKSWLEMSILEKQNATLNIILAQSANAVGQNIDSWEDYNFLLGDAAKTSASAANQFKLLGQGIRDAGAEIGRVFLPIITEVVTAVNQNLPEMARVVSIVFSSIGNTIRNATGIFQPFINEIQRALSFFGSFVSGITGLSRRLTKDSNVQTQERIKNLQNERNKRIEALKNQTEAQKTAVSQSSASSKKESKARQQALKDQLDDEKDAISERKDLLKESTSDAIDLIKDEVDERKDSFDLFKDNTKERIDLRKEELEVAIDAIDEELEKVDEAEKRKLEALDNEFKARLKLIDSEAAAQIESLEMERDAIKDEEDRIKLVERRSREEKKLGNLRRKIEQAIDPKDRARAEKDLIDFQREIELKRQEEARKNQLDTIKDSIKNIQKESREKQNALKEENDSEKKSIKDNSDRREKQLKDERKSLRDEFDEFEKTENKKLKERTKTFEGFEKLRELEIESIRDSSEAQIKIFDKQSKAIETRLKEVRKATSAIGGGAGAITPIPSSVAIDMDSEIENINAEYDKLIADQKSKIEEIKEDNKLVEIFKANFKKIIPIFSSGFNKIFNLTDTILKDIFTSIDVFLTENNENINLFLKAFKTLFVSAWEFLKSATTLLLEELKILWDTFGLSLIDTISILFEILLPIFTNALAIITDIFNIFTDIFKEDWGKLWEDVKILFSDVWTLIFDILKNIFNGIKGVLSSIGESIKNSIIEALGKIKETFNDFKEAGKEMIFSIIDGIVEASKELAKKAVEAVKNALEAAREFVSGGTGVTVGIEGRATASAGGGGGGTRGLSSQSLGTGISATTNNVNVTINNNNDPSPSDIARQINKQSTAMALNFQ